MFINFITTCLLLAVLELATTQNNQVPKPCKITDDIEGECILLQKCPRALDLLKLNDIKSLRSLTCGYDKLDAKVCCITNKTDGISITFKNTTQDIATSRPAAGISKNTVKVPPDPVATYPPTPPQTEPTTRVIYTTTFAPTTPHIQKKTYGPQKNDFFIPTTTSVIAASQPPAASFLPTAVPPHADPSSLASPIETLPTFDNPLGIETDIPSRFPVEEDVHVQSEIMPSLPEDNAGAPGALEHVPIIQSAVNLPGRNECGLLSDSDRIYGGQVAGLEELPWLARIKYLMNSKEVYACHATLITDRYLITAAHCIVNQQIIEVRLGEWDASTDIDCIKEDCSDPPVNVKVEAAYIHPTYQRKTLVGDIGLLRLAQSVNFTEFIRPVCLPTTDYIARIDYDVDTEYITGGWGKTEYETSSVIKRKIQINAVPMQTCRAAIRRISDQLAASSICAGGRKGVDSCAGDSGSSLVRVASENRRLNWFLFGVTSFGSNRCGTEGIPGIYSRVTYYMDWIMSVLATR